MQPQINKLFSQLKRRNKKTKWWFYNQPLNVVMWGWEIEKVCVKQQGDQLTFLFLGYCALFSPHIVTWIHKRMYWKTIPVIII